MNIALFLKNYKEISLINHSAYPSELSEELNSQPIPDDDMDLTLFERLRNSLSLPALPPIASHILRLCREEDASVDQLAALISQDPAVVTRLLQVANSSYYGGSRHKVTSVAQAVTLIGMNAVGTLAVSFCVHRLFQDMKLSGQVGIDHRKFWRRSIFSSVAGRTLGQWVKLPDCELPFLGALLQDIGLLGLNEVAPEVTRTFTLSAKDDHLRLQSFENQYFGCDHATMGTWLAESWQLPEEFQNAIRGSHHPEELEIPEDQKTMVYCVALSGLFADIWCHPDTERMALRATTTSQRLLQLTAEDVVAILEGIPEGLVDIASFFQTQVGNAEDIDQIFQTAKSLILASSVESTEEATP